MRVILRISNSRLVSQLVWSEGHTHDFDLCDIAGRQLPAPWFQHLHESLEMVRSMPQGHRCLD